MPYIDVRTSAPGSADVRNALLSDLVATMVKHFGKPEAVTMARLGVDEAMVFAGSADPSAFVEIRAIGLPDLETRRALVGSVSALLAERLGLRPDRTFVVFDDVPGERWGFRGTIPDRK